MSRCVALILLSCSASVSAQQISASMDQLASNPLVTVRISEQLRSQPDEATLTAGTESKAPSAAAALAADRVKSEQVIEATRRAGIPSKDIQTEGVSIQPDYEFENAEGRSVRRFVGYAARDTVRIKTHDLERLGTLLDALTAAGATQIYGPTFGIMNPAPLRAEARQRAMVRGQAEASEYARSAGFTRVQLLSVEEGISTRSTDIVVTGNRLPPVVAAPPAPPPPPGAGIVPGEIETGVMLTLQYRMER